MLVLLGCLDFGVCPDRRAHGGFTYMDFRKRRSEKDSENGVSVVEKSP